MTHGPSWQLWVSSRFGWRQWAPCLFLLLAAGCSVRSTDQDPKGHLYLRSISWSATPTELKLIMELVDEFNRRHPDIPVRHEVIEQNYSSKLLTAVAAGNAPDLFWVHSGEAQPYIQRKVLYDITDFIRQDHVDVNDFYPSTLRPYESKGRYYSLPNDACSAVVFYNRALFRKAGLPDPHAGWSWDDFLAAARRLTLDLDGDGRPEQWGFVMSPDIFISMTPVFMNGGLVFDPSNPDRALFTQPVALQGLRRYFDLALVDHVAPLRGQMGDQDSRRGFQMGRVAMMFSGWWDMTDTDIYAPDLDYGVVELPRMARAASPAFSTGTGIYAGTLHPREAWEFVRFMTGPEGQLVRCKGRMAGPSRRSVARDPYFIGREKDQVFLRAMESSEPFLGPHYAIMADELVVARDRVLQEVQTTEQSFKQAEKNFYRRIQFD